MTAPAHDQPVGLVLSDRDPPSAMAVALLASVGSADLEAEIKASLGPV